MRRRIIAALGGLVACATVAGTGLTAAQAATHAGTPPAPLLRGVTLHPVPVNNGQPAITVPVSKKGTINRLTNPLLYHGGPVQQDPQLFVLYWGLWWSSTCSGQLGNGGADEAYLGAFYNGLATSSDNLSPIASQYYGPAGNYPIFRTAAGHALITENVACDGSVPASATDAQLAAEAVAYASYLASVGYTISNNTQIVVVSPSGTNPGGGFGSQYCAYHNWAQYSSSQLLSWTNLPYMPDQGGNCGANFVQNGDDGWSIVGGHEYMESVTDPFVNNQSAWYDGSGQEIGDKCAWTGLFVQTTSTGSFAMQPEWDNRTSSCHPSETYLRGRLKLTANTALCITAGTSNGAAVKLTTPCSAAWSFINYPSKGLMRWQNSGMCVTPQGGSSADGTPLVMTRCADTSIQKWSYSSSTGQWKNGSTGKCVRAPTAASGAALVENTCGLADGTEQFSNV